MDHFISGLDLAEMFYGEAVKPVLDGLFGGLPHSAALIGTGSEVLGFDTPLSTDHMWGPRLQLFLAEGDFASLQKSVARALSEQLPPMFKGYATSFGKPDKEGVRLPEVAAAGSVNHLVEVQTIASYFSSYLGVDPREEIDALDWLTFPEQKLLTLTGGRVFHDELGLDGIRHKLAYYPHDVWLYLLASQWTKIAQEQAFVGRCGEVGDELGSQVVATRLVQFLIRLCFLMEKRYAPYIKWLGSALSRLDIAKRLGPALEGVLAARSWPEREAFLSQAYRIVAERHNSLRITDPMPTTVSPYYGRPFLVIHAETFAEAIRSAIEDKQLLAIPRNTGSVDQFVDSTDVLTSAGLCRRLKVVAE